MRHAKHNVGHNNNDKTRKRYTTRHDTTNHDKTTQDPTKEEKKTVFNIAATRGGAAALDG